MAIIIDQRELSELARVASIRIRAARKAAEMTQEDAARSLGYRGVTQVSLAEKGERLPTLKAFIGYANLYRVPLDFLVGRIDDPDLDGCENSMAVMARAIGKSMETHIKRVADACSMSSVQLALNRRSDRQELCEAAVLAKQAAKALERIHELNPDFDELKGGAPLLNALNALIALGQSAEARTETDRRRYRTLKTTLELEEREMMQLVLPLDHLFMMGRSGSGVV